MNISILVSSLKHLRTNFKNIVSISSWIYEQLFKDRLTKRTLSYIHVWPLTHELMKIIDDPEILTLYINYYRSLDINANTLKYFISKGATIEDNLMLKLNSKDMKVTRTLLLWKFKQIMVVDDSEIKILVTEYGSDFEKWIAWHYWIYTEFVKSIIYDNSFKMTDLDLLVKACSNGYHYTVILLLNCGTYNDEELELAFGTCAKNKYPYIARSVLMKMKIDPNDYIKLMLLDTLNHI